MTMSSDDGVRLTAGSIIKNRWQIIRRCGEGGCGVVYEVKSTRLSDVRRYALKMEPTSAAKDDEILKMEGKSAHVCELIHCGKEKSFNFMVMNLLGSNLGDIRRISPQQHFTMSTAVRMARQALAAICDVHKCSFVHRDIKPANFALGSDPKHRRTLFVLDFGLARTYLVHKGGKLVMREERNDVPFRGTVRYCSVNVHARKEQGRHDDLLSWTYLVVEMIVGQLPWRTGDRKATYELKKKTTDSELFGDRCPPELRAAYKYIANLKFAEQPDYGKINGYLKAIMARKSISMGEPYDWEVGGCYEAVYNKAESTDTCTTNTTTEDEKGTKDVQGMTDVSTEHDAPDIA